MIRRFVMMWCGRFLFLSAIVLIIGEAVRYIGSDRYRDYDLYQGLFVFGISSLFLAIWDSIQEDRGE